MDELLWFLIFTFSQCALRFSNELKTVGRDFDAARANASRTRMSTKDQQQNIAAESFHLWHCAALEIFYVYRYVFL